MKPVETGVVLVGQGEHRVRKVVSRNNTNDGFDFNPGSGFDVDGLRNRLAKNKSNDNVLGFHVQSSSADNTLTKNESISNNGRGFVVNGQRNALTANLVEGNDDSGIELNGDDNRVFRNITGGNGKDGIEVVGLNNTIVRNTSFGNANVDLTDSNLTCDANIWRSNKFDTRNQPCVQ